MLRDLYSRPTSSKNSHTEESENMPRNSGDYLLNQTSTEPTRPPLNAIQEPFRIPRAISDPEMGSSRANKPDRTPVKQKPKYSDAQLPLRTPEKQGATAKDRYNLAQKFDSSLLEAKEEVKTVMNMNTPGSFRVFGRYNSSNSDCASTQSTPAKSVNRAPTPGYNIASGSRPPLSVGTRLANYAVLSKGNAGSGNFCNVVNNIEVPYFELKEDPSFWMEHNVQVLIRMRPLSSMEKSTVGFSRCLKQESSQSLTWIGQPETRFVFDHVACEAIDQDTLFRMVGLPMVENCLSGYNSCMFAYGQTGSGKTYTMLGEIDGIEVKPSPSRGMTPRIFEFLFARIRAEEESRRDERLKYNCKCSFLEIYNEQISDLLDPSSTNLMIREDMKKGVYVEDLSEFEVQTVGDILQLLTLGSSNRRVAATNMNRESSRSHSVFTCVIESRWEKDSTTNYRFARLNLVDLAGSERQKSSGAEGDRLKEAANINKSLSTLGHVIMVLVDIANGRPRHVPYRDSRLTFLLQDSLGGNSKTVIIANVSPSLCSAAETLNTLKFAQRAKLIQNNAVINEDSSGDINSMRIQIQLLKEELSALKLEKLARPLSYGTDTENKDDGDCNEKESKGVLRVTGKQLKSLEATLTGSLRREQMAEISTKQRAAEIEHLNRLVSQREEDTRCTKMMLKFREDKIQRLESLIGGLMSTDDYLLKENHALSEEIQLLRGRIDKNPEVTRFALENIRLLEKVQQFQDLYDEGEREMLMAEISELRNQVIFLLDKNSKHHNYDKEVAEEDEKHSLHRELRKTISELEETRSKLNCCLEENATIRREIEEMCQLANKTTDAVKEHHSTEMRKDSNHGEDIMNLHLELDILKIILQEERSSRASMEKMSKSMSQDLHMSNEKVHSIMKEYAEAQEVLKSVKLVVEALESQQIELINDIENLKDSNDHYQSLVKEKELEITSLREQIQGDQVRNTSLCMPSDRENSVMESKLKKMHESLEKAKRLNVYFQNGVLLQEYDEEEMEEARKQVEAETAEVIVSLQEELCGLHKEIEHSKVKEIESREKWELLKKEAEILEGHLYSRTEENEKLARMLEEKEKQLSELMDECSSFATEVESNLYNGNEALKDASEQVNAICASIPQRDTCFIQQFGRIKASMLEKELLIEELSKCLREAVERRDDMDFMLRSLRGAVMAMTETHQQECNEKDKEILLLASELNNKESTILELLKSQKSVEYQLTMTSSCATAALVIVNRLWELHSNNQGALNNKDVQIREFQGMVAQKDAMLCDQASVIGQADKQIRSLQMELEASEGFCVKLKLQQSEVQREIETLRLTKAANEEIILQSQETIKELASELSTLMSCVNQFVVEYGGDPTENKLEKPMSLSSDNECKILEGVNSIYKSTSDVGSCLGDGSCVSILTLKKEADYEIRNSRGLQVQIGKLSALKAETFATEKCSQQRIESLTNQAILLRNGIENFGVEIERKVNEMDDKIGKIEELVQGSFTSLLWQQELLEAEADDAKVLATQKIAEASSVLKKFEEVQDTMKEADIMINELMIANEALKLSVDEVKAMEHEVSCQRTLLLDEVQTLRASNEQKDLDYATLENRHETDLMIFKGMLLELEDFVFKSQTSMEKELVSASTYLLSMEDQLHQSAEMHAGMLEEVWSEIIIKEFAMSVLHICYVGTMETMNELNAENGLLCHDLSESKTIISELQEQNFRVRRELEMCSVAEGNFLTDIHQIFSLLSSKLGEAGEISHKLTSFEVKMQDLQLQEEKMSSSYANMGSEIDEFMKELESSIRAITEYTLDGESLVEENDAKLQYQEDVFMVNVFAMDIGLLILTTELERMTSVKEDLENSCLNGLNLVETCKKDIVLKGMDATFCNLILLDQERDNEHLLEDLEMKELSLQTSFEHIMELNQQIQALQNEVSLQKNESSALVHKLEKKDEEVRRISCLENESEKLQEQLGNCRREYAILAEELDNRKSEFEAETHSLRDKISCLENCITRSEADLIQANSQAEESILLRNEVAAHETNRIQSLIDLNLKFLKGIGLTKSIHEASFKVLDLFSGNSMQVDDMFEKVQEEIGRAAIFVEQIEYLENLARQFESKVQSLEIDLSRKDDVLKGLLFDLSLLQESASSFKDQKDEMIELQASLSALEKGFELKSLELDQAVVRAQILENQLQEKTEKMSALEMDSANDHEIIRSLSCENSELLTSVKDALDGKDSVQKELKEARMKIEKLEMDVVEMETAMAQMSRTTESLKCELDTIVCQRDELDEKFCILTKELELARALAEDKEAVLLEAQESAEFQKLNAEEKEAEAKLLERSIEELECTINVLERKVDIIKGEAEQQRLQREELELELLGVKEQLRNVESNDLDIKRSVAEKEKSLQDALRRVQLLEKEITARDNEISKCKSHISELNLHAEAQADEYKQKFKALEIMMEQLKSEVPTASTTHTSTSSSSSKLEKSASKPKGSGSPFKCIGLGLAQQLKSEKDEELSAGRQRIEELETLAASRQKEIFMLKARLATTESMTHDVIRDLLGVKLNMKNYADLMENQELNTSMAEAEHNKVEADTKEQEVLTLKQQINEFISERKGWLEEIERKQAEMMAAHVALEKLRRQEQMFSAENDILKMENSNQKKRVMELESEVKKLSGQQNIQQRIHHHAKIKEENNLLRSQNEQLSLKLHRTEAILVRVEKELAQFRAANGRKPYINFDEEQLLDKKLKETEQERMELAQKLLGLCTSVLKAAGIKRPKSEISPSVAEEALELLKNKFLSLEMELEDAKLKSRISNERARLSELRPPQASTSPRRDEIRPGHTWMSQTSFNSTFDR